MKQALLFIGIFVLGAIAYAFLNPFLLSLLPQEEKVETVQVIPTPQPTAKTTPIQKEVPVEPKTTAEDTVTISEDGSVHDGPFSFINASGEKTAATAAIVRSPEEVLLQFSNFTQTYSSEAHVYFSNDLDATKILNLGPAKMASGVLVYGIPLDTNLDTYSYILIYNPTLEKVEYSAKIK